MQPSAPLTADVLARVAAKVAAAERLSAEDGLELYDNVDIHTLGELANEVRERLHGRRAYFIVNRHINYTNYCVLRCKFCAFYRPYPTKKTTDGGGVPASLPLAGAWAGATGGLPTSAGAAGATGGLPTSAGHDDAYALSVEEMVDRARQAYEAGATEVHIVGGLHPKLPFSYYTELCSAIREACPKIHLKAFTAIEIIHFTRICKPRMSIGEVLTALMEAGLDSMPGGGAEIFDDRVHDEAYKNKVGEAEWFEVHRTAHELGLPTNATMLYGHVETQAERIAHMVKLREHQDESIRSRAARFNCFIPLSFIPDDSALSDLPGPTGLDDLRTLAISRLMLDNFAHIKAFWIMQTPKLAQVSLNWGVDDIDGTVVYYDITKREGAGGNHQELTAEKLQRLICETDCIPIERDSLYRQVIRDGDQWRTAPLEVGATTQRS
ncbi:MAG: CofH family radical SAM protein [Planctomycetes bacterium]|nr:CofH family radical SAM protein [Planctomycetota bacterium]